ncbi:hypothetical protein K7F10_001744 [Campylobacter jejuni]|nr:hypothetical protein [Campylobacter jejuni]
MKGNVPFKMVKIVLKNSDKIKNIDIEISKDYLNWLKSYYICYNKNEIKIYLEEDANFLKFNNGVFFLNIEFYEQLKPIFMMQSPCGWGDRMIALLNAMYLSKKLNGHFGFTWTNLKISNSDVCEINVCEENELFDDEFIEQHSYSDVYESPIKSDFLSDKWIDNIFIAKDFIEDYLKKPFQYDWGYCTNHLMLNVYIKNIKADYCKNFPVLWSEIQFSKEANEIFDKVEVVWEKINNFSKNKGFIAIHARSGDSIYNSSLNLYNHTGHVYVWHKALPVEILMELIEIYSANNILLFGEDIKVLKSLCLFYKNLNIFIANDYIPNDYRNSWKEEMFDLVLMSKIDKIIGGYSGFSRLASLIGNGKESTAWIDIFDEKQRQQIFFKHFGKLDIHIMQQAYSLGYMYFGEMRISKNFKYAKELVKKAIQLDPDKEIHNISLIYCHLMLKEYDEADRHIEYILHLRRDKFLYRISHCIIINELKYSVLNDLKSLDYPYISFLYIQLFKDEIFKQDRLNDMVNVCSYNKDDSAVFRVKNSLSYRLGEVIIKTKNISSVIKLPFLILIIILDYKMQKFIYNYAIRNNPKLKLKPIDFCYDYNSSLVFKNHLSYRIGNLLVKHPFTFILKVSKTYKDWKKYHHGDR